MSIRRLLFLISVLVLLYIVGIFCIYILIDFIVFSPVKHSNAYNYKFDLPFKEFKLQQPNNEKINVVQFKPDFTPRAHILFLHGAEKSIDYWATNFAPFLIERNYSVLFPDYRGYGKSDGRPSEFNWYEDAQLSYSYLKSQVGQDSIIIVGYGLGAVAASYLANLSPCRMVILIDPIYGIRSWIRQKLPALILLPRDLKYDFNSYEYIPNIISPLVLMINKNNKSISKESIHHLKSLLPDQGSFIELDHHVDELPLEDSKFVEFFDLLMKDL
ncbi:MAG: alpha/beta fold hydrolase [Saprospiraceae bacterium]